MTIYIISALCLLSFALLSEFGYFKTSKTAKAAFLSAGSLILFFISAFRFDTGYDYRPYTNFFTRTISNTTAQLATLRFEKGYVFLNRYIQLFVNDFQVLFIIISLIVIILVYAILLKYCKNPSLGLLGFYLLGYYFVSMDLMRNLVAGLIVMYSYKYIKEKDFMRFIVIVLLASTFHLSALVFIPFYFILRLKFNYITFIVHTVVWGTLLVFSRPIMDFVTTYIYSSYDVETSVTINTSVPLIDSIFPLIIFISIMLLGKELEKDSDWTSMLLGAAYMETYFGLLGLKHMILNRFALYFGPIVTLILVPNVIRISYNIIKNKSYENTVSKIRIYFCLLGTCVGGVGYFLYALYNNYNGVIPHEWIWNVR